MRGKINLYWQLVKPLQSGLLLLTGIAGFATAKCPVLNFFTFSGLVVSLALAIGGSTAFNMVIDSDIDLSMGRTRKRPLPSGKLSTRQALTFAALLSASGIAMALYLSPLYGLLVAAGLFFDVVVYSLWLKRRTPWSIVWGGIAGAMPIMAGRALGTGRVDLIGVLLGLSILLWIPTHILTFSMKYYDDYRRAGIPTFPSVYGFKTTRWIIALSSIGAALAVGIGILALGLSWGYLRLLGILSVGLLGLAIYSIKNPSERVNLGLFKYASFFMLGSMLIIMAGTVL